MQDIRIALAQITCPVGSFEEALDKHRTYTSRAAEAGAALICFPELSLSGYPADVPAADKVARPLDDPLVREVLQLSRRSGLVVVAGLVEQGGSGSRFNTQLVAGPDGLIGVYRKTHIGCTEQARFQPGNELPVFECPVSVCKGGRFGVQICFDNHFPEAARSLALRGAEWILAPYASPGPCTAEGMTAKRSRWLRYQTARAFDNSVYLLAVNQVGASPEAANAGAQGVVTTPRDTHSDLADFPGGSMVINPWGEVIAQASSLVNGQPAEELLLVDLSGKAMAEKRGDPLQFFDQFRRPELYGELVRSQ